MSPLLIPEDVAKLRALAAKANESVGPLPREGAYTGAIYRLMVALDGKRESLLAAAELLPLLAEALEPFVAKAEIANGLAPSSRTSGVRFKARDFRDAVAALEAYRQALGET